MLSHLACTDCTGQSGMTLNIHTLAIFPEQGSYDNRVSVSIFCGQVPYSVVRFHIFWLGFIFCGQVSYSVFRFHILWLGMTPAMQLRDIELTVSSATYCYLFQDWSRHGHFPNKTDSSRTVINCILQLSVSFQFYLTQT